MMVFEKWKQYMASVCLRALNGEIKFREFYDEWPDELHSSELAELIYEDLEEGIQHTPFFFFFHHGQLDWDTWKRSDMYQRILIASEVLKLDLDENALKRIHDSLLHNKNLPLSEIGTKAKELAEQERGGSPQPKG